MGRLSDIKWAIHSKESMSVLFDLSQFNVRLRRSTPTQHVQNVQIERPNAKYAENCVTLLKCSDQTVWEFNKKDYFEMQCIIIA